MSGERDLIGYGATPPDPRWPGGAKVAVQFVVNYEEGGENSVLYGDQGSEAFLSEMVGAQSHTGMRAMAMESLYEYGSRAGFWRLHRLVAERGVPLTVFGVAKALEANPAAVEAMLSAGWEIASHGYRWIDYQYVPEAVEREHIARAIELHTALTGWRPQGWYQGRTSPNTARLVVEEGGFTYDADSYADDLPYSDTRFGKPQRIVPDTLDGIDEIRAFRNGRGGSPQRRLARVEIATYGDDFATANAEFFRAGSERRGRQSQSWVRFADGWKVVSAHVSLEGTHA